MPVTRQTPSQTIGPFFAYALIPETPQLPAIANAALAQPDTPGQEICIEGKVFDGDGNPVPDAILELWQADHNGDHLASTRPPSAAFTGFGRTGTNRDGSFRFDTIKPGRVPDGTGDLQAPHLSVILFARGLLSHLFTRIYFSDEVDANQRDRILRLVDESRRSTIVADRTETTDRYRFDIHLQGDRETVFFDA
jgi:protocatechuate 3,4-dioxygenase alpha subunit